MQSSNSELVAVPTAVLRWSGDVLEQAFRIEERHPVGVVDAYEEWRPVPRVEDEGSPKPMTDSPDITKDQSAFAKFAEKVGVPLLPWQLEMAQNTIPRMTWKPIETAPRNGEWFLAWWPEWSMGGPEGAIETSCFTEDAVDGPRFEDAGGYSHAQPTHWMPLPAPPTDK